MMEKIAYDLGLDLGFLLGYDKGFEDGSWAGYFYALDKLRNNQMKRDALIVVGTVIVVVPLAFLSVKVYKILRKKYRRE